VEHLLVAWDQVAILLLPLPLIAAANLPERPPASWNPAAVARLRSAFWLLLAVVPASSVTLGLLTMRRPTAALIFVVTGLAAASLLLYPTRAAIARTLPIDPSSAMDATALVLSLVLLGSQFASQASADLLAQEAGSGVALGPIDLVAQEVPFLLAAVLGVGLFFRRSPGQALDRLGLTRPTRWQLLLALAAAGVFYAFGNGVDVLSHLLTPGLAGKVDAANQRLFGQLGDPLGIATIALSAASARKSCSGVLCSRASACCGLHSSSPPFTLSTASRSTRSPSSSWPSAWDCSAGLRTRPRLPSAMLHTTPWSESP